MSNNIITRLAFMLVGYLILKFFGGSFGHLILYPVTLLVTFLHEFGHALGAIITGGKVEGMQINPDGSGYTVSRGGSQAIILMGGYLGSVILGNLLLYIGVRKRQLSQMALYTLAIIMFSASILWFESFVGSGILVGFAVVLYLIANRTNWEQDVLMFFGLATVLYIIQDFNVGPKSDLAMYENTVGIFPSQIWMYIWLGVAVLMTFFNVKNILRSIRV
jgi:Peptidase M50B-like